MDAQLQTDNQHPRPFFGGGPFTCGKLKEIIRRPRGHLGYILTDLYCPPRSEDLRALASRLNDLAGVFRFTTTVVMPSDVQAADVRDALKTLMMFFDKRVQAAADLDIRFLERELRLRDEFDLFLCAFQQHPFDLDMDAGALMPRYKKKNWRDVATAIAELFRFAMRPANPKKDLGNSNDGPVARFVAAVIPMIVPMTSGEPPTIGNVAKHLKDEARKPMGTISQ